VSPTTLAAEAIQRFLATRDTVVLATVKPDGAPLAMPMWFLHDPEALVMISVDGLAKVQNLRRDGRVCVVAEAGSRRDLCGIIVQGAVEFLPEGSERRALADRFRAKYDPELTRIWGGRAMPPNRVMFRIVPTRVRSWGLGR
jgi:PPOX class probable F420-dependent enzyme